MHVSLDQFSAILAMLVVGAAHHHGDDDFVST
jgi:hypothetical protein